MATTGTGDSAVAFSKSGRYLSLDGLRGVAAVVVVVSHFMLLFTAYADATYPGGKEIAPGTFEWVVTYTPLHIFWAGTEVVYVFFILSGIVLMLPIIRRSNFSWLAYYPSRVVRLYGPVIVAVVFAALTIIIVPRGDGAALGAWINSHPSAYTPGSAVRDAALVGGTSGVVGPLWSLRWEVLFSLLLPLYVVLAKRFKNLVWLKLIFIVGVVAFGSIRGNSYFMFLPMFAIGILMATHWPEMATLAERLSRNRWTWPTLVIVGIVLMCIHWELQGLGFSESLASRFEWVAMIGAAIIVGAVAFWGPAQRVFSTRVALWLGKISFSLYLVHEPIIVAARQATVDLSPWVAIGISLVAALVVTVLFSRFVEQPFHRMAQKIARSLEHRSAVNATAP